MSDDGDDNEDFSDGLDEFEDSAEDYSPVKGKKPNNTSLQQNKPYDEAYELSQDLSVNESFDARGPHYNNQKQSKDEKLHNDKYDEAVDVSQSIDQSHSMAAPKNSAQNKGKNDSKGGDSKIIPDLSRTGSVTNAPFDEALEFSHSGDDESVDTRTSDKGRKKVGGGKPDSNTLTALSSSSTKASTAAANKPVQSSPKYKATASTKVDTQQNKNTVSQVHHDKAVEDESWGSEDEDDEEEEDIGGGRKEQEEDNAHESSYDNIEGAYKASDYAHLNVPVEVKDLFRYIERYKPHEVELDTTMKCFVPEFIPAIGEMDGFVKVPRPDGVDDELGLKILDEPATMQSDSSVLELRLRSLSKKQQYGDVVVRSIERADKNPHLIEKWIQSIDDLHRSKPPPQVHYRKNMPDIESLMEVWPEQFESALETMALPSPDLDLSLAEYAKVLCAILDIPMYDNPIESLHVMFSLFTDFRNNPHFQAQRNDAGGDDYGGADVMEINQGN